MSLAPVSLCLRVTLVSDRGAENDMTTSVQLSAETEERLEFLVSETGLTKSSILQEIIERGLDDVEDYYLAVVSTSVDIEFFFLLPADQGQGVHQHLHTLGVSFGPSHQPVQLAPPYRMQPFIPVH